MGDSWNRSSGCTPAQAGVGRYVGSTGYDTKPSINDDQVDVVVGQAHTTQAWPDCNLGSVSGVWAHPSHPGHHLGPAIALASALASALALSLASAPASAQTLAKTSSLSLMQH